MRTEQLIKCSEPHCAHLAYLLLLILNSFFKDVEFYDGLDICSEVRSHTVISTNFINTLYNCCLRHGPSVLSPTEQ